MTHHTECGRLQYISTALQSTQHTTLHVVACNTLSTVLQSMTHHTACGRLQYISTALQST